jgi:lysophospholipase L1-like esterase
MKIRFNSGKRILFAVKYIAVILLIGLSSFALFQHHKPTLYIIGDSTVKNGSGTGSGLLWGWGTVIGAYFDTAKINVENDAIGGRSSRTFITEDRWNKILVMLKPGDFVIMQFGHNDGGPLDDTARARGSIKGIGDESRDIYNPIGRQPETVHTYGWYMRKYVDDAKAKGAIPIICSPVPRNIFKDRKTERSNANYGLWAEQVAKANGAYFIPLNDLIADQYDAMGPGKVKTFFPGDHTHTNREGAVLNSRMVIKGIKGLEGCKLKDYLVNLLYY